MNSVVEWLYAHYAIPTDNKSTIHAFNVLNLKFTQDVSSCDLTSDIVEFSFGNKTFKAKPLVVAVNKLTNLHNSDTWQYMIKLAECGVKPLHVPVKLVDSIQMECHCGNVYSAPLKHKLKQIGQIEPGKLFCKSCSPLMQSTGKPQLVKRMKSEIPTRLRSANISWTVNDLEITFKGHNDFTCGECGHIWNTTPQSILNSVDGGSNGCPNCVTLKKDAIWKETRDSVKALFDEIGVEVLTPEYKYTRTFVHNGKTLHKVKFRKRECGHEFETLPTYFIGGYHTKYHCPVCGKEDLHRKLAELNSSNVDPELYESWKGYRQRVDNLTNINYRLYEGEINPNGYTRGLTGNVHQLDHIVPVSLCYWFGIPDTLAADRNNLQMLTRVDNANKSDDIIGYLPDWFIQQLTLHQRYILREFIDSDEFDLYSIEAVQALENDIIQQNLTLSNRWGLETHLIQN